MDKHADKLKCCFGMKSAHLNHACIYYKSCTTQTKHVLKAESVANYSNPSSLCAIAMSTWCAAEQVLEQILSDVRHQQLKKSSWRWQIWGGFQKYGDSWKGMDKTDLRTYVWLLNLAGVYSIHFSHLFKNAIISQLWVKTCTARDKTKTSSHKRAVSCAAVKGFTSTISWLRNTVYHS